MKIAIQKLILPVLALCVFLSGTIRGNAQTLVTVDPNAPWVGYMNVFSLPVNGGGYIFGSSWALGNLRGGFNTTNQLILRPCTNVWETGDTFWVQGDGVTPNEIMDANFYVQDDTLVNTNVVFIATCASNTLTATPEPLTGVSYTSVAFIKQFDAGYGLISSVTTNLTAGQTFSITANTTGATHVQYGFETMGPDGNPGTADSLGTVVLKTAAPSATVTVDPSKSWVGFMNVFSLPADGGGYVFGSSWGLSALRATFDGVSLLTLQPDTNVWNPTDSFWVKPDGVTPNKNMDASLYVQNDGLANTNLIFIGTCVGNTLTTSPEPLTGITYTSVAFIKAFNSSFSVIGSAISGPLVPGQSFGLSLNTAGAAHVQYGFETIGPDANPGTADGLGTVTISATIPGTPAPTLTNNAPTPTRSAANVLSLYNSSGVYTNHPIERWLASWSGAAENTYVIAATGRSVLKYSGLQYAGVEFYNNDATLGAGGDNVGGPINYSVNTTGYDTLHVDVWTPNANQLGIQLVSLNPTQPAQVDFLPASGTITNYGWVSLDIPLSSFTAINGSLDLTDLQQMLWIDNQSGGGVTGGVFYMDNVYFYNSVAIGRPTITATVSGGSIHVAFATANGSNYTLQYKNNLSDATWQDVSSVSGNGLQMSIPDTTNQKNRFYRLYVH
ncbi:MAG TPA: hypothetical protein VG347_12740 [Verrucomicrobiae bacterium]|nr:hypothetical protein [Verrucomicrobiae bacterium]